MQTVTEAAEQGQPVLMYCKVGKDRTGLLAALIAAACDASDEDILTDYHRYRPLPDMGPARTSFAWDCTCYRVFAQFSSLSLSLPLPFASCFSLHAWCPPASLPGMLKMTAGEKHNIGICHVIHWCLHPIKAGSKRLQLAAGCCRLHGLLPWTQRQLQKEQKCLLELFCLLCRMKGICCGPGRMEWNR